MTTFIPSRPSIYKGNRRYTKIVGGDELVNDAADMLTEPLPAFEQRCASIYADWEAFVTWVEERRRALTIGAVLVLCAVVTPVTVSAQPPMGGTVPPVTGIACIVDGAQPDISGCNDKVFMPLVVAAVTEVTR